jgi:hypothetical protein
MHKPPAGKPRARAVAALIATLLIHTTPIAAGGRHRAVAVSTSLEELTVTIVNVTVPGSDALLDAGSVAGDPRSGAPGATIRRTIGLRIGAAAAQPTGKAVLRASIRETETRYRVRVDGLPLTQVPRLIDAAAPRGVVVNHRLEIEVPPAVPAGSLEVTIDWEATAEQ